MRKPDPIPELDEGKIKQIYAIHQAHKDVIKSIAFIAYTDVPLIFTAGLDKMAKIWDLTNNHAPRGVLQQGYMLNPDYKWDFPLKNYSSFTESRQTDQMDTLKDIREERDQDRTYKKQALVAKEKYGNMRSSLGFTLGNAGASLVSGGFEGTQ
jgi:WD40 repeat protein